MNYAERNGSYANTEQSDADLDMSAKSFANKYERETENPEEVSERLFNFLYANEHTENQDMVAQELGRKLKDIEPINRRIIFHLLENKIDGDPENKNYKKYKTVLKRVASENPEFKPN